MPITINFELSDSDIEDFVAMAKEGQKAVVGQRLSAESIAAAARDLFEVVKGTQLPDFISERLNKLGTLADMVTDPEWRLPEEEMERVLSAMSYFSNPDDLIPDRIPAIGFLDDAIMAELVVSNLDPEISAYQDFCRFRTAEEQRRVNKGLPTDVSREDWIADKRAALHSQMRRRRSSGGSSGWRVSLW
jgi:uncharacterized membrane protein YkvA (DUF1232 family)